MSRTARLAVNPLPWTLEETGLVLSEHRIVSALTDLGELGFSALQADLPPGWSPSRYRRLLQRFGFRAAPGYFAGDFADRDATSSVVEAARRHAAVQAELGLDVSFLAHTLVPDRREVPALGINPSKDRTAAIAAAMVRAAEAAAAEGITFALHPHVASFVETESETRQVLDLSTGSALAFGPDTGHLFWAGADVTRIIGDYGDRVAGIHLKDVDQTAVAVARFERADYRTATRVHHVWTEPGRGAVSLEAALSALPTTFRGWTVLEVDVPNLPGAISSTRASRNNILTLSWFANEPEPEPEPGVPDVPGQTQHPSQDVYQR